jgi:flavin reductase (DIM6/NTAB) family NADH-FMN oxidoreductase RutF
MIMIAKKAQILAMFYNTKTNDHNLASNPFKSCIVPRPIAWISTKGKDGVVNLAPYSYFNAVADSPPVIMFASGHQPDGSDKDSLRNIQETGEFVVNIASYGMHEEVNLSSSNLAYGHSEAEHFAIETLESKLVKPPRVASCAIALECKLLQIIEPNLEGKSVSSKMILGHVIGIYIDDNVLTDGKIDIHKLKPIARLGYNEYAVINDIFKMSRQSS